MNLVIIESNWPSGILHDSRLHYRGYGQYEARCSCGWTREPAGAGIAAEAERNHRIAAGAPEVPT